MFFKIIILVLLVKFSQSEYGIGLWRTPDTEYDTKNNFRENENNYRADYETSPGMNYQERNNLEIYKSNGKREYEVVPGSQYMGKNNGKYETNGVQEYERRTENEFEARSHFANFGDSYQKDYTEIDNDSISNHKNFEEENRKEFKEKSKDNDYHGEDNLKSYDNNFQSESTNARRTENKNTNISENYKIYTESNYDTNNWNNSKNYRNNYQTEYTAPLEKEIYRGNSKVFQNDLHSEFETVLDKILDGEKINHQRNYENISETENTKKLYSNKYPNSREYESNYERTNEEFRSTESTDRSNQSTHKSDNKKNYEIKTDTEYQNTKNHYNYFSYETENNERGNPKKGEEGISGSFEESSENGNKKKNVRRQQNQEEFYELKENEFFPYWNNTKNDYQKQFVETKNGQNRKDRNRQEFKKPLQRENNWRNDNRQQNQGGHNEPKENNNFNLNITGSYINSYQMEYEKTQNNERTNHKNNENDNLSEEQTEYQKPNGSRKYKTGYLEKYEESIIKSDNLKRNIQKKQKNQQQDFESATNDYKNWDISENNDQRVYDKIKNNRGDNKNNQKIGNEHYEEFVGNKRYDRIAHKDENQVDYEKMTESKYQNLNYSGNYVDSNQTELAQIENTRGNNRRNNKEKNQKEYKENDDLNAYRNNENNTGRDYDDTLEINNNRKDNSEKYEDNYRGDVKTKTERNSKNNKRKFKTSSENELSEGVLLSNNEGQSSSKRNLVPEEKCGLDVPRRIIGGTTTDLDEFPWMCLLQYVTSSGNITYDCSGVLISKRYVLTAAHCTHGVAVTTKKMKLRKVRLGEWDITTQKDCQGDVCSAPIQDIEVEDIIPHEQYKPKDKSQLNDIALIRLQKEVNLNQFVQPICLPLDSIGNANYEGKKLTVSGWGKTSNERSSESKVKMKVDLPVVNWDQCRQFYKSFFSNVEITRNQFCAGGEEGQDSCQGDSGGPLMSIERKDNEIKWYVIGIVSSGPAACAMKGRPSLYTNVSQYTDWILDNIKR